MTKIIILNIGTGLVGLPNYRGFMPGETAELSVTNGELEQWRNCKHIEILDTAIEPGSMPAPSVFVETGDTGCLHENIKMGVAPFSRRSGRPRKVEPGNPGEPESAGALESVAEVHSQPGQPAVSSATEDLIETQCPLQEYED